MTHKEPKTLEASKWNGTSYMSTKILQVVVTSSLTQMKSHNTQKASAYVLYWEVLTLQTCDLTSHNMAIKDICKDNMGSLLCIEWAGYFYFHCFPSFKPFCPFLFVLYSCHQLHSYTITPPLLSPSFTLTAVGNHAGAWLADRPSCCLMGRTAAAKLCKLKMDGSQKEKVTIAPESLPSPSAPTAKAPLGRNSNVRVPSLILHPTPCESPSSSSSLLMILLHFLWDTAGFWEMEEGMGCNSAVTEPLIVNSCWHGFEWALISWSIPTKGWKRLRKFEAKWCIVPSTMPKFTDAQSKELKQWEKLSKAPELTRRCLMCSNTKNEN